MFSLDSAYSNYYDMSDPDFPKGKAVDAETDEGIDGTPYKAKWMNNILGAFQAVFFKAFGTLEGMSNEPDNIHDSDFLKGIMRIISDSFSNRVYQFETKEPELLIPWSELSRNWNSESKYVVVAQVAEDSGHTCVNTFISELGVRLKVSEIKNGVERPMKRVVPFGSFKWGEKKWGEKVPYKINLIIQEVLK